MQHFGKISTFGFMTSKIKYLILLLLLNIFVSAQTVEEFLTADTWNIAYRISDTGERTEEPEEIIPSNWVKFNTDGTFETPDKMTGRHKGKWKYNPETNAITFTEKGSSYKAVVDEISDIGLLLNYADNGGFKLGLIHYVFVPKEKSNEQITDILISGKWLVSLRRYDGGITEKTPDEQKQETWYVFNPDNTYEKSEYTGSEVPVASEGTWYLDDKFQLNLDSSENSIYTVVGDKSKLIFTTTSGGYNTIEMTKAK